MPPVRPPCLLGRSARLCPRHRSRTWQSPRCLAAAAIFRLRRRPPRRKQGLTLRPSVALRTRPAPDLRPLAVSMRTRCRHEAHRRAVQLCALFKFAWERFARMHDLKAHRRRPAWPRKRGRSRLIGRTTGGMNTKLHAVCDRRAMGRLWSKREWRVTTDRPGRYRRTGERSHQRTGDAEWLATRQMAARGPGV